MSRIYSLRYFTVVATLLGFGLATQIAIASITIDSSSITAHAAVIGSNPSQNTFTGTTIPTSQPLNAFASDITGGTSYSNNQIDWTTIGGQTILSVEMVEHNRSGIRSPGSGASAGINAHESIPPSSNSIQFTLTSPTSYLIGGAYTVQGTVDGRGDAVHYAALMGSSTSYFNSNQSVMNTKDVAFVLGTGAHTGSLSGTLPAGTYNWLFAAAIRSSAVGDNGAMANGFFTLTLGDSTDPGDPGVIPEATSFLIWILLGLTTLMPNWRRLRVD